MTNETEKHADLAPMPVGFCDECLGKMKAKTFVGVETRPVGITKLEGGYCPHNRVAAVRTILNDYEAGPWRLVTPCAHETLLKIMERSALAGYEIEAAAAGVH